MNVKLVIYFLVLLIAIRVNANSDNAQDLVGQKIIELPWSDCTEIQKLLEKKFSFSEQQLKKENKIHEEYKQFYLKHKSPSNFSMQFLEKQSENDKVETLISGFIKFCEDNFRPNKSRSLNYQIKQQQEQQFNDMKNKYYEIYYKQKYNNNILLPSYTR
ncbi:MAG TPA: DUF2532 domain-containing protein [Rickettsia endosymbiont of Pyrocoelia pectoralis]|nr:DUF2532 domain-containing protein [Rickettsia endosymbiont of Pyrocoelia pectoralis]